jgi:hypothetical protein
MPMHVWRGKKLNNFHHLLWTHSATESPFRYLLRTLLENLTIPVVSEPKRCYLDVYCS